MQSPVIVIPQWGDSLDFSTGHIWESSLPEWQSLTTLSAASLIMDSSVSID